MEGIKVYQRQYRIPLRVTTTLMTNYNNFLYACYIYMWV